VWDLLLRFFYVVVFFNQKSVAFSLQKRIHLVSCAWSKNRVGF